MSFRVIFHNLFHRYHISATPSILTLPFVPRQYRFQMEAFVVREKFVTVGALKKGEKMCQWQIGSVNGIEIDVPFLKQLCFNPVSYALALEELVECEWRVR